MNILKRFNDEFGLQASVEKEQEKFVQRINALIFQFIESMKIPKDYADVYQLLRFELGLSPATSSEIYYAKKGPINQDCPKLIKISRNDFNTTLLTIEYLSALFDSEPGVQAKISDMVQEVLSRSVIDIGIRWSEGRFYKSGSEQLDADLIEDPQGCLLSYPELKAEYVNAVKAYTAMNYKEMITKCFNVVEALAQKILKNTKTLDNNKDELIKVLNLSQDWKSFVNCFFNYANSFARHGKSTAKQSNPDEAEAFLYLSGLFIRLIVKSANNRA